MTRHENRFGITSFIYRARLPFHPGRLYDYFLDPFFIFHGSRKEEIEETSKLEKLQKDAGLKQVTQKGACPEIDNLITALFAVSYSGW